MSSSCQKIYCHSLISELFYIQNFRSVFSIDHVSIFEISWKLRRNSVWPREGTFSTFSAHVQSLGKVRRSSIIRVANWNLTSRTSQIKAPHGDWHSPIATSQASPFRVSISFQETSIHVAWERILSGCSKDDLCMQDGLKRKFFLTLWMKLKNVFITWKKRFVR